MSHKKYWAVPLKSIGLWSWCGRNNPWIEGHVRLCWPWQIARAEGVLGWGFRESGRRANAWAQKAGAPTLRLEDGFLRSVTLGVRGGRALSCVVDDMGIYYDASYPSRLEKTVQETVIDYAWSDDPALADARRAMDLLLEHGLSKYNHAPDFVAPADWRDDAIVVVDQTFGDVAVKLGGADAHAFERALQAAIAENPDAPIWIKTHPDVMCGKKRGYLTEAAKAHPRVRMLPLDVSPLTLLKNVGKVYAVSSQMGFEALLCGKPVVTFGLPWYAGWGLTDDRHADAPALARRRGQASLVQLFHAAYLRYCRYIDPATNARGDIFAVIAHLADARRDHIPMAGDLVCVGLSFWKRSIVTPFLRQRGAALRFVSAPGDLRALPPSAARYVVLWGAGRDDVKAVARELGLPTLRMEDGFIRSVGLGSNLVAPLSLVIDDLGIYFDPRTPSRLERILADSHFDDNEIADARAVREALLSARIGKYNVGQGGFALPVTRPGKVILVPGQVEDDASIRTGSPWVSTNLGLLREVRQANPEAFVVFKPHPDVVCGNRHGAVSIVDAALFADLVVPEADVIACVELVDEVHTMTSLTGFEALLRGKNVVCYGAPFYAGWGLTTDIFTSDVRSEHGKNGGSSLSVASPKEAEGVWARRTRRLSLDELVAGTLLRYPRYVHPHFRTPIHAKDAVAHLLRQKRSITGKSLKRNWVAQQFGKVRMFMLVVSNETWLWIKTSIASNARNWLA